jgi:gamma-glutamylcyclotransferase (GGCT)/AIG2-like uncharacterized protein YtfP
MGVKLFVYGTLKKGNERHHYLKGCQFIGYGKAKGFILYDLGEFPGMIKGDGEVAGEVYEVPESLLKEIDWVEGVPDLFRRELIEVLLEDGQIVSAYAYIYNETNEDERNDETILDEDLDEDLDEEVVFEKDKKNKKEGGGVMAAKKTNDVIKFLNPKISEFVKQVEEVLRKRELKDLFFNEFHADPDEYIFTNDESLAAVKTFENIEIGGRIFRLILRVVEDNSIYNTPEPNWKFRDLGVIFNFEKGIETEKKIYRIEVIFKLGDY